ncbi:MAG: LamG domain-containing protein, partial [Pedosphaera sp.]|nr:LamG domain-containing protein [Pedosphaera sp.]
IVSDPARATGLYGEANGSMEFNASERDVVNVGHHPVLNGSNGTFSGLTFSAWIRTPQAGVLGGTMVSKDGTVGSRGWRVEINATTGRVQFITSSNGVTLNTLVGVSPVNDGQWHHVAASIGPGGKKIYVDSYLDNLNATVSTMFIGSTAEFMLGLDSLTVPTVTGPLHGKLDQVRVYNIALPDVNIAALYSADKPGTQGMGSIKVNFLGDLLTLGDSVRLELFSDVDTSQAPFHNQVYTTGGASITHSFLANTSANAWQNLRGGWRVSGLSGSVTADSVVVEVNSLQFIFSQTNYMNRTPGKTLYNFNAQMNRDVFYAGVVQLSQATSQYTFCHELGHLLSASHGMGDDLGVDTKDASHTFSPFGAHYNYVRDDFLSMGNHFSAFGSMPGNGTGNAFGKYCTIMAYTQNGVYQRIPRYSSPTITWRGVKTGTNHDRFLPPPFGNFNQPLYMDNVYAMSVIGKVVTHYRDVEGSGRIAAPSLATQIFRPPQGIPNIEPTATTSGTGNATQMAGGNPGSTGSNDGPKTSTPAVKKPATGLGAGTSGTTSNPGTSTQQPTTPTTPTPPTGRQPGGGLGGVTGTTTTNKPPGSGTTIGTTNPPTTPTNPAPPANGVGVPNDQFENGIVLQPKPQADGSLLATDSGHNIGATVGPNESTDLRTDDGRRVFYGRTVWWVMQAARDGVYDLDASTAGSNIDTTLSVFLPGSSVPQANDNGAGLAPASRVMLPRVALKAGDKVYFAIDGVNGAEGRLRLTVRLKPGTAANAGTP